MLTKYFEVVLPELRKDQRFAAQINLDLLQNQEYKKLFIFILPIVKQLEEHKKLFQAEFTDLLDAIERISMLATSFQLRLYRNNIPLDLDDIDFGFKFAQLKPLHETKIRAKRYLEKVYSELLLRTQNSTSKVSKWVF